MRRRSIFALVPFIFGSLARTARGQTPRDGADATDQIRALEQEWLTAEARRDNRTLGRLIADDFIGLGPAGNIVTKEELVPQDASPADDTSNPWSQAKLGDLTVRLFGDTAFVIGAVERANQKPFLRFSKVFMKRQGSWQMVAAHLARAAQ